MRTPVLALFGVYVIRGSTCLALRFAIESLPLLLLGGIRYVCASARPAGRPWKGREHDLGAAPKEKTGQWPVFFRSQP